jgi:hypothetical protein
MHLKSFLSQKTGTLGLPIVAARATFLFWNCIFVERTPNIVS